MENNWEVDLQQKLSEPFSLQEISDLLREIKGRGIGRDEIRDYLYQLRKISTSDKNEDDILEVLDIVEGFCNEKYRVW